MAFSGALVVAELGAAIPEQGGPYAYFLRIFGRRSAFLVGLVTAAVGYFAAAAAVALSVGEYLENLVPQLTPHVTATLLLIALTAIHATGVRMGAQFNNIACGFKLILLLSFIVAGALVDAPLEETTMTATRAAVEFSPGGLASAMVLVFFAYSGWDTASYVAGEIKDAPRNLPWALLLGTGVITVCYLAVNLIFLKAATPAEMSGISDVGHLASTRLFGKSVGRLFTASIVCLLISTASAILFVGPRVLVAMSKACQLPRPLGKLDSNGSPMNALWLQGVITIAFVWTVDIGALFTYVGLLLSLCAIFTISGSILFRRREPDAPRPFRMPLYPLPALIFVAFSIYTVVWSVQSSPWPLVASAGTLIVADRLRGFLRPSA